MARPAALDSPRGAKADWLADAREEIETLARRTRTSGDTFTADDIRTRVGAPDHQNWPGIAFSSAHRQGIIEPAGFTTSTTKSRHRGVIRTWRAAGS